MAATTINVALMMVKSYQSFLLLPSHRPLAPSERPLTSFGSLPPANVLEDNPDLVLLLFLLLHDGEKVGKEGRQSPGDRA